MGFSFLDFKIDWWTNENTNVIMGKAKDGQLGFYIPRVEKGEICVTKVIPQKVLCIMLVLTDLLKIELFAFAFSLFLFYMASDCSFNQFIFDFSINPAFLRLMRFFNIFGLFFMIIRGMYGAYMRTRYEKE